MTNAPDETRMSCLKMAMEVALQTPGTDVVALAERFIGFLSATMPQAAAEPVEARKYKRFAHYREIIQDVAVKHLLTADDILGDSRVAGICAARYEAIREVYDRHPTLSTPTLGKIFNRDHTSILYALKKTEAVVDGLEPLIPFPEPKPIRVGSVSIIPAAYTVKTFCECFGVGRSLVYAEMNAGRLLYRKAGRKTLFRRQDAEAWLEQHTKRAASA